MFKRSRAVQEFVSVTADGPVLSLYRIDLSSKLAVPDGALDDAGVPYDAPTKKTPAAYHPTTIGQYALARWNAYLTSHNEQHRHAFLTQARWLVANEVRIDLETGGWPIPYSWPDWHAPGPWLSALTQGIGISVLVRAFQLTNEEIFLDVAMRAVRTFERDILDGGVSTPLGGSGVFFEEVAVYPAGHILNGHLFGLFGLYDYLAVTGEGRVAALIQRSLRALEMLVPAYDTGYWSRYDLLYRHLASPFYHALHVAQLRALAQYSDSAHWAKLAARWDVYQSRVLSRMRQFAAWHVSRCGRVLSRGVRRLLFRPTHPQTTVTPERVVVPVTGFPIMGGIRAVLTGLAHVMAGDWQMDYLARDVGPHTPELTIYRFGSRIASPWHFPTVWLYVLEGASTLIRVLRRGYSYRLVLPQDSVFTGAFSAVAGKLAGARVVCIEHGTVTFPYSLAYHRERLGALTASPWPVRLLTRVELALYWPSIRMLARLAVRFVDHFLVAGDESEKVYVEQLGVPPYRITRWRFTVDVNRFQPPDLDTRVELRKRLGLARDTIVVALIARLSPEKGLDIALRGIWSALSRLPTDQRKRVRVVIAGDGPLRPQVEADLRRYELENQCAAWGQLPREDVIRLLGISDIFLYTSRRGTNYSMAVLEAMAAGCAVIASTEPISNRELLAQGRGLAIPPEDSDAVSRALVLAISDQPRCREMGRAARAYVAECHGATAVRRALLRATYWPLKVTDLHGLASQRSSSQPSEDIDRMPSRRLDDAGCKAT